MILETNPARMLFSNRPPMSDGLGRFWREGTTGSQDQLTDLLQD